MSTAIFIRAGNVGGHNVFRPAALAKELSTLGVVNIGAAGTFVARKAASAAAVREAFAGKLRFQADIMVCRGEELLRLAQTSAFDGALDDPEVRRFITVLARRPRNAPPLPIEKPEGDWQSKVLAVSGPFVLSLWRRRGPKLIYPNEVVERHFPGPSTTRNWNTIQKVCALLREAE